LIIEESGGFMKIYPINNLLSICIILAFILFPAVSTSDEIDAAGYVIKKGDTLWDISSEKLKDPFQWPKIWKANPYIKDPHWIYPGNKLVIPDDISGIGKKEKEAKSEQEEAELKASASKKAAKRKDAQAIIPEKIIPKKIPVLQTKYLVSMETLLHSGYISEKIKSVGKITGSLHKKTMLGKGDYVFIDIDEPIKAKTKFYIVSEPEKIEHPKTNDTLGYLTKIKGILEIIGEDNNIKKAVITDSFEEIRINNMLSVYYPVELPLYPDIERRPAIQGTIVKIWNKHIVSGDNDVVYLDKGLKSGVMVGDIFNIIADEKPNITMGTIQVISVTDKTSAAIVKSALGEINHGYFFKN
jgi:LysM repeat protein